MNLLIIEIKNIYKRLIKEKLWCNRNKKERKIEWML